jgi:hypothetical protein
MGVSPAELGIAGLVGLLVVGLTVWRPAAGCAVFALAVPLTAGLGRGTVIPFLRPNEALALLVLVGLAGNHLWRPRPLAFNGLDLIVAGFALGEVLIPWLVLYLGTTPANQDNWRTVLSPIQYLVVYVLFSRSDPSPRNLRLMLNLVMLASIVVAVVAIAELLNASARNFIGAYYPTPPWPSWDPVYRPASLLGHYSAVGGFALMNCVLALALATTRAPGFAGGWLSLVMIANIAALLTSETWAPLVTLPVAMLVVLFQGRRFSRQLVVVLGAVAICLVVLWPAIAGRVDQQQLFGSGSGLQLPASMATRIRYWQEFFLPAAAHHFWLGTGTTLASEVPQQLGLNVDNEYLFAVFRAGVSGLVLLIGAFIALAVIAWGERRNPDPMARALAAACAASVVTLAIVGLTSQYLTFTAVSQMFWMLVGLFAARRSPSLTYVDEGSPAQALQQPARLEAARAWR